jgi:hypothetical protein
LLQAAKFNDEELDAHFQWLATQGAPSSNSVAPNNPEAKGGGIAVAGADPAPARQTWKLQQLCVAVGSRVMVYDYAATMASGHVRLSHTLQCSDTRVSCIAQLATKETKSSLLLTACAESRTWQAWDLSSGVKVKEKMEVSPVLSLVVTIHLSEPLLGY